MGLGKQAFIDKRENILNYRDFSLHTGKRMVYLAEVRLIGEIDATNAPEVDKLLLDAVAGHDSLVLDMEGLAYVSSAGLRAFKHAYTEMQKKGGTLSAKNAGEVVQEVLKVTGFARLFKMI